MKSLIHLDNTAKAKLLHELFPEEINPLLENIKNFCADFEGREELYRQQWDSPMVSFDLWMDLSKATAEAIRKFEFNMIRSSKVFSDQLCYGYQALFVNDRIMKYADSISADEKFKLMVQVLYY